MHTTGRFRIYFLRGLAVLLPTILTIWIFFWGYKFIQENISVYINRGIVQLVMFLQGQQQYLTEEAMVKFWVHGWGSIAGFLIALIVVCVVGAILASVVGKTLWRMIEKFIMRTPLLKEVYPYIKQITDFLLTQEEQKKLFSRVVAVECFQKDVWSMGFVTATGFKGIADDVKKEFLTVVVPTSPTPFTGFVVMVPKEKVIELDMTVEEAVRFIISAGVIAPQDNGIGGFVQPPGLKN
ncbi:MAG: DUF502 domain-containing protein [Phycisphaerae bacterium]|jgi:uncharacterized membrane protein